MSEPEAIQPTTSTNDPDVTLDDAENEEKEIIAMKERVAEMEREAKMLRDMQAQADTNTNSTAGSDEAVPMETDEDKGAADARSVHVGNVDYAATPEEIQSHFNSCGIINRVTILCDKFTGHPKGYAYVEFSEPEHVDAALALDGSTFRARQLKVMSKRTNIPGFNRGGGRGRGRGGYRGGFRGTPGFHPYRARGRGRGRGF